MKRQMIILEDSTVFVDKLGVISVVCTADSSYSILGYLGSIKSEDFIVLSNKISKKILAYKIKDILDREIASEKVYIYMSDIIDEAVEYFKPKPTLESTMVDMKNIFIQDGKIVDNTKKKTRELS